MELKGLSFKQIGVRQVIYNCSRCITLTPKCQGGYRPDNTSIHIYNYSLLILDTWRAENLCVQYFTKIYKEFIIQSDLP